MKCPFGYAYDDAGGIVTTTAYNALDRPVLATYSDNTPSAAFAYDQGTYGIGQSVLRLQGLGRQQLHLR